MNEPICCTPKYLPQTRLFEAASAAVAENALNHPHMYSHMALRGRAPTREEIAVDTKRYWRTNGVRLTVGFLDQPPVALKSKILEHMNAWGLTANVAFVESMTDAQVRISRDREGYWSYLGTDILLIDRNEPTMNLQGFTMKTPDSEFFRVVRHETGHTLGCPHEHMRRELVDLIDPDKAIEYYGATQGWTPEQVRAQVLTPLEDASIMGTPHADQSSIMCYQIPGQLTKTGKPILGGLDIDQSDYAFMAKVYPKDAQDAGMAPRAAADRPAAAAATAAGNGAVTIELANGTRILLNQPLSIDQIRALLG